MRNSLTKIFSLLGLSAIRLFFPISTYAQCPVCAVAVAGGLGVSRWLGIDDVITSLWLGAFFLSSSLWLANTLKKRWPQFGRFPWRFLIVVLTYALTLYPLSFTRVIGHPLNRIFNIDKVLFGVGLGSLVFWLSMITDKTLRKIMGRQVISFQKAIVPLTMLSLVSYILFRYLNTGHP